MLVPPVPPLRAITSLASTGCSVPPYPVECPYRRRDGPSGHCGGLRTGDRVTAGKRAAEYALTSGRARSPRPLVAVHWELRRCDGRAVRFAAARPCAPLSRFPKGGGLWMWRLGRIHLFPRTTMETTEGYTPLRNDAYSMKVTFRVLQNIRKASPILRIARPLPKAVSLWR